MEMETIKYVLEVSASEMVNWDVVERLLSKINEFRISIPSKFYFYFHFISIKP
jgi:hypothetical protein